MGGLTTPDRSPLRGQGQDACSLCPEATAVYEPWRYCVCLQRQHPTGQGAYTQGALLLLPMIDPTDPLAKLPNLTGPFEVIVFDPAMNQEYKRQVHLLVITPDVQFALPTPSITLTLAAVCEIVLECDARLVTKDVFNAFYDNPLAKFRAQLKEVCSDPIWGHAAIYGYRTVQERNKEKTDLVHQCLLKVQQKHRIPLLSASGHGDLVVRDFVAKGDQVQDLSIIPRFWPIDRSNKADLIKAASTIAGYRGIAVTKRHRCAGNGP